MSYATPIELPVACGSSAGARARLPIGDGEDAFVLYLRDATDAERGAAVEAAAGRSLAAAWRAVAPLVIDWEGVAGLDGRAIPFAGRPPGVNVAQGGAAASAGGPAANHFEAFAGAIEFDRFLDVLRALLQAAGVAPGAVDAFVARALQPLERLNRPIALGPRLTAALVRAGEGLRALRGGRVPFGSVRRPGFAPGRARPNGVPLSRPRRR